MNVDLRKRARLRDDTLSIILHFKCQISVVRRVCIPFRFNAIVEKILSQCFEWLLGLRKRIFFRGRPAAYFLDIFPSFVTPPVNKACPRLE